MAEREQVKPLAPAANRFRSSEEDDSLSDQLKLHRRKSYAKCCGCAAAILVIISVTMLILAFTVFHVRGPIVRMNSVAVDRLRTAAKGTTIRTDVNLTLTADVSVKNPNAASFRYGESKTVVYYGGAVVGEGTIPPGSARARRTRRMNLTVEIFPAKILAATPFTAEWSSGALNMESYTKLEGRVKILNIVKKRLTVKLNCTMTYNVSRQGIQRQKCKSHINL